ncbi:hypothetical protein VTO73DRAFT_7538 [Trametes versicolor]
MRQRSSKASRAKTQATGFYQPKHNASRSYSTSGDGRRKTTLTKQFLDYQAVARQEELHAAPQPPPRATPLPSSDESLASALGDDAPAPERVPGLAGVAVATKTHAKRYESSDEPLATWMQFRNEYLDEVLRLEGRGRHAQRLTCPCGVGRCEFRCVECLGGELLCQPCTVAKHELLPLHRIERWEGTRFRKADLRGLGLVLRPAHNRDEPCVITAKPSPVVVLHINGVHVVNIQFCECKPETRRVQLLRMKWWPATPLEPKTCATFALLRQFHLLNLQGKVTAYDFYRSLELGTDNTGLESLPDRSSAFATMVRQWRHITMAKGAGRGHDASLIEGTKQGGLAVACRACPQPGVNLPLGWEDVPPEDAWLYQLMISQDANFRLKSRLRQSSSHDPWLSPGLAYFVDNKPYGDYVSQFVTQEDVRTCSGFAALLNAMTRHTKGLRATGVVAVSCRHELFMPKGMGDMQKGERSWANVDYVLASAVSGRRVKLIKDSYDVGCEHEKGFFERARDFPAQIKLEVPKEGWTFVVPKFHISAHKEACQGTFSPNYTPHMGRFDGEGVERNWPKLSGGAASTKEMTPGGRWETLDDFCGFANWRKTVQLGNDLLRLMIEAIPEAVSQKEVFTTFDKRLRLKQPLDVQRWEKMVLNWECDRRNAPSPFLLKRSTITRNEVRLRLLASENLAAVSGAAAVHDAGPSSFIVLGLDIRVSQLTTSLKRKESVMTLQQIAFQKRASGLLQKIQRFRELQIVYMPKLQTLTATELPAAPPLSVATIDTYPIVLPSDVPSHRRLHICSDNLIKIEDELQYADACDALEDLRHSLRMRTAYNQDKIANVTGQVPNTRARDMQQSVEEGVKNARDRYRKARSAIERLRGSGNWENALKPLADADIVGLNERALTREEQAENERVREMGLSAEDFGTALTGAVSVGEGRRMLSWIWYTGGGPSPSEQGNDHGLQDALRVEWAKARARAHRWSEQVRLLHEEMRRVLESTRYAAKEWNLRRSQRQTHADPSVLLDDELDEGLKAYADEHCAMETGLADAFEQKWAIVREMAEAAMNGTLKDDQAVVDDADVRVIELEIAAEDEDHEEDNS